MLEMNEGMEKEDTQRKKNINLPNRGQHVRCMNVEPYIWVVGKMRDTQDCRHRCRIYPLVVPFVMECNQNRR